MALFQVILTDRWASYLKQWREDGPTTKKRLQLLVHSWWLLPKAMCQWLSQHRLDNIETLTPGIWHWIKLLKCIKREKWQNRQPPLVHSEKNGTKESWESMQLLWCNSFHLLVSFCYKNIFVVEQKQQPKSSLTVGEYYNSKVGTDYSQYSFQPWMHAKDVENNINPMVNTRFQFHIYQL